MLALPIEFTSPDHNRARHANLVEIQYNAGLHFANPTFFVDAQAVFPRVAVEKDVPRDVSAIQGRKPIQGPFMLWFDHHRTRNTTANAWCSVIVS